MSSHDKTALRLDWCSHTAARYAVEHWHYSHAMPKSKLAKIGVWERGEFVGVVVFGVGATPELCKPYALQSQEVAELVRVALNHHATPTSRIVAIALRLLKSSMVGLRLIVSFADTAQGHHGGIYQAGGWVYTGDSFGRYIVTNGKTEHPRTLGSRYGVGGQSIPWLREHIDPNAHQIKAAPKHRYLMPLDAAMKQQIAALALPYPKRAGSIAVDASPDQGEEGGASPTPALHTETRKA
jgi:hypothetical protein